MPTRAELEYIVSVNDRDLRELGRRIRETNRHLVDAGTAGRRGGEGIAAGARRGDSGLRSLNRTSASVRSSLRGVALAAGGIGAGAGLALLGREIVTTGFRFDNLKARSQIAFETILRDTGRAKTLMSDLQGFAERTPFNLAGLIEASQRLLALGFNGEQVIPILQRAGDAVAGLGGNQELLDRVLLALGQINARGVVSAEEMRQLGQASIGAWQALAAEIGVSVPEAMKLVEKRQVDSATGLRAILGAMEKDFGGLMQRISGEFSGTVSNLQDVGQRLAGAGMAGFFRETTNQLRDLLDAADDPALEKRLGEMGETTARKVVPALRDVVDTVRDNWPAIRRDLGYGVEGLRALARAANLVSEGFRGLAAITPGGSGTLIHLIVGGVLLKKTADTIGGVRRIGREILGVGTAADASGKKVGRLRGSLRSLVSNPYVIAIAVTAIGAELVARKIEDLQKQVIDAESRIAPRDSRLRRTLIPELARDIQRQRRGGASGGEIISGLRARLGGNTDMANDLIGDAFRYSTASRELRREILGLGADSNKTQAQLADLFQSDKATQMTTALKAQREELKKLVETRVDRLSGALDRLRGDALGAFDAETDRILAGITVRVSVLEGGIRRAFTLRGDEKTPAERELAALDEIDRKRQRARDLAEARKGLRDASKTRNEELQVGDTIFSVRQAADPERVKAAQERLGELERQARREQLEKRAQTERLAADAARVTQERELRSRRDLERRHFEDELTALSTRLEQGKIAEENARSELVRILGRYGVDLKNAAAALGTGMSTMMIESLDAVESAAGRVRRAVLLTLALDARLKAMAAGPGATTPQGRRSQIQQRRDRGRAPTGPAEGTAMYVETLVVPDVATAAALGDRFARKVNRR